MNEHEIKKEYVKVIKEVRPIGNSISLVIPAFIQNVLFVFLRRSNV